MLTSAINQNWINSPVWQLPVLFATGVVAGWIDSIAGGGGLITLPVLLNFGLAPADAFGTNKLQSSFGSGNAALHYGKAGLIDGRTAWEGVIFTAVGALLGAWTVQLIHADFLRTFVPFVLIGLALYFLFRPQLGETDAQPRLKAGTFYLIFGLALGFYDGFFGPGTGSFWATAYVLCLGFNLTKATAHTKLMNFTSNLVSLATFALGGHVHLIIGLAMGAGQLVGTRLGAKMVIKRGTRLVRPLFIAVVVAITVRLLWTR